MRQWFPAPPQPWVEAQTNWSLRVTRAVRKRRRSAGVRVVTGSSAAASRAMPMAPCSPGRGGTITSAPVWRATAAASASEAKGMPWQKITWPTERLPLTRLR